jgi:hypothetical protein
MQHPLLHGDMTSSSMETSVGQRLPSGCSQSSSLGSQQPRLFLVSAFS